MISTNNIQEKHDENVQLSFHQILSKVELQTGTPFVCAETKFCSQGSKMLLRTLPSFISLFPDHSFYVKVYFCQKWSCRQELPQSVRNSNFALKALKCFSGHFFVISIYSQTSPSMRKQIFVKSGVADGNLLFLCGIWFWHAALYTIYFTVHLYTTWRHPILSRGF